MKLVLAAHFLQDVFIQTGDANRASVSLVAKKPWSLAIVLVSYLPQESCVFLKDFFIFASSCWCCLAGLSRICSVIVPDHEAPSIRFCVSCAH